MRKNVFTAQILLILAGVFIFLGCEQSLQTTEPESAPGASNNTATAKAGANINREMISQVTAIQNRHGRAIMDVPGVVGFGTALGSNGQPSFMVFTEHKGVNGLPDHLEGIPVRSHVTGRFRATTILTDSLARPVPVGASIGHPDITAGTLGCRVTDGSEVYILSNNHVIGNSNLATIGDPIYQPGPYDGGAADDAVASLFAFVPIAFDGSDNTVDAAIALTSAGNTGFATPADLGYGAPSSTTVAATLGLPVQKVGRTTGWTHGTVSEINVTVNVCYEEKCSPAWSGNCRCTAVSRFVGQIGISDGSFSGPGDSGSLIVTDDENKNPVGLLFAGSDTRTLANPIDDVLTAFNVSVDAGGPVPNQDPTSAFSFAVDDLTVSFTDESTDSDGSIASWSWDFGDGNVSSAQNPAHTYAAYGNYTVTLSVTDDDGAVAVSSQVVSLAPNQAPTAAFSVTSTNLTANFTDESTDSDGSIVSWNWDFGDGNNSTEQNPSHSYAAAGTYTVNLTVTDDDGAVGNTSSSLTVTDPPPGVSVTGITPNSGSVNSSVNVTITGTGFAAGAQVTLENGSGPSPNVTGENVLDANTLTATINVPNGGPKGTRLWDVRVTNPDGGTDVLGGGFTVIR